MNFRKIYEHCKNNNIKLNFVKELHSDNVQGSCGLLDFSTKQKTVEKEREEENQHLDCRELISDPNMKYVFYKYGNSTVNFTLARQEYLIGSHLMETCGHLPNFLRTIIYVKNVLVLHDTENKQNPFSTSRKSGDKIDCVDMAVFEYLDCVMPLSQLLTTENISSSFFNSIFMQLFLGILCAQQNAKFVHNDLHPGNVLILKCDKNVKFLYRLKIFGKEHLFLIPSFGYFPVIIDYGFAYSKECENRSLECADCDQHGLITYQFDELSDFIRLFVVILCAKGYYNNAGLQEKIKSLLKDLPIDRETSWEKVVTNDTTSFVERAFFEAINIGGDVKYTEKLLKLMMRNILMPVTYRAKYKNLDLKTELQNFFFEWINIEKWLKYTYEKLFVFRELTDIIRKSSDNENLVRKAVHDAIINVCGPSGNKIPLTAVKWDILIKSLKNSVGLLNNIAAQRIQYVQSKRKTFLYKYLVSSEHLFSEILPELYQFNTEESSSETFYTVLIDNIEKANALVFTPGQITADKAWEIFRSEINSENEP